MFQVHVSSRLRLRRSLRLHCKNFNFEPCKDVTWRRQHVFILSSRQLSALSKTLNFGDVSNLTWNDANLHNVKSHYGITAHYTKCSNVLFNYGLSEPVLLYQKQTGSLTVVGRLVRLQRLQMLADGGWRSGRETVSLAQSRLSVMEGFKTSWVKWWLQGRVLLLIIRTESLLLFFNSSSFSLHLDKVTELLCWL